MILYSDSIKYYETIKLADDIKGYYNDPITFHCFWNGSLNEKHYISILSCYYFNIINNSNRKIILWTDSDFDQNEWYDKISGICEIKKFSLSDEIFGTFFAEYQIRSSSRLYSYISDIIRYVLLYNYGGVWFDLDIIFLKNIDGLLSTFKDDICVYNWGDQNYPNGAFFMSLEERNTKFENFVKFLILRNRGFGFQESQISFNDPVDLLVLPCSWFDPPFSPGFDRIGKSPNGDVDTGSFFRYTDENITLKDFTPGSFCYHWHNRWYDPYEENSFFDRLKSELLLNVRNYIEKKILI